MSELEDKLNTLLSDPDSMSKIMQMAQSLSGTFGGESAPTQAEAAPEAPQDAAPPAQPMRKAEDPFAMLGGIDPKLLGRILPLLQEMNRPRANDTTQLLLALRPFLKNERQEKVERAIQLARMIHIGKKFFTGGDGLV